MKARTYTYDVRIQPYSNKPEYAPHYIVNAENAKEAMLLAKEATRQLTNSWGKVVSIQELRS